MTETDTIKIRVEDKEYLDELMDGDEITEYGSLTYADCVQYMCDLHRDGALEQTGGNSAGGSGVNRRSADGSTSGEDDVQEKIDSVRLEDGGGTRNNDSDSFPEDEEDVTEIDAESLAERSRR